MAETKFSADYSKRLSKCKRCKKEIAKGSVRLAKVVPNFFAGGDNDDEMKQYFHVECLFESFQRARATTKIIEAVDDIEGYTDLAKEDQKKVLASLSASSKGGAKPKPKTAAAAKAKADSETEELSDEDEEEEKKSKSKKPSIAKKESIKATKVPESDSETESESNEDVADDKLETFNEICERVQQESSHLKKSAILKDFFAKGAAKKGYKGDMCTFVKLLLPSVSNRVYNLNSKQIIKLYSQIFDTDADEMSDHLNQDGDVSKTCRHYFAKSTRVQPARASQLSIQDVDKYLDKLTEVTKEADQLKLLEQITRKLTKKDLQTFIRLVKKDLRIDAGSKLVLDSVATNAYAAFQVSRDLADVVKRANKLAKENEKNAKAGKPALKKDLSIKLNLMTPIKPMLAEACKSAEQAFIKCKNRVLAEVKYDGERLQVHKNGAQFSYFSRNLKQVQPHKVSYLKEYIPKALPTAKTLIIDGEVLLYDTKTKKPLPFGTLGKHKKNAFQDATVCLYVFDCLYFNGEDLTTKPMCERRKFLLENMTEIPGRIMFSEQKVLTKPAELRDLMMKAIKEGLEGLVLKDEKSIYEPGKRHWLKMKKDYLDEGKMADTADLVVLGAYYGTGNKGGLKSVFLMGTYNEKTGKWHTVTKVGNGFDDRTLAKLQKQIDMVEIKKNADKVPAWLDVHKSLVPDFVVKNPKNSPVWELTGAEFSKSSSHTAAGISIRFPRVTKVRDDKTWKEATNLEQLKQLFKVSKEKSDINEEEEDMDEDDEADKKKNKKPAKSSNKRASSDSEDEDEKPAKKVKKTKKSQDDDDDEDDDSSLPAIFSEHKFLFDGSVENKDKLKRYIAAFDGQVVDVKQADEATHFVVTKADTDAPATCSVKVKKVLDQKLWESIKKRSKLGSI